MSEWRSHLAGYIVEISLSTKYPHQEIQAVNDWCNFTEFAFRKEENSLVYKTSHYALFREGTLQVKAN